MSKISLRPATPGDAAAIARAFTPARRAMPGVPDIHTAQEDFQFITHTMLPDNTVTVADSEGLIAGVAAHAGGWLNHLYVHPDHHRRGIGTALLAHVMAQCPQGLDLWVFQSNTPPAPSMNPTASAASSSPTDNPMRKNVRMRAIAGREPAFSRNGPAHP